MTLVAAILTMGVLLAGQNDLLERILKLEGLSREEDLSEEMLERYHSLSEHPLRINSFSRDRLAASGLFNPFQLASLLEHISSGGPVYSYMELSLVDGFSSEFVSLIRPFIDLQSNDIPGKRKRKYFNAELMSGLSSDYPLGEEDMKFKAKARLDWSGLAEARISSRKSFNVKYSGNSLLSTVILGDLNLRCGQGLLLWSGFSMSGIPSPDTFDKRPSGISAPFSYNPSSFRGGGVCIDAGESDISAIFCPEGRTLSVCASYLGRNCSYGLNSILSGACKTGISLDWRQMCGKSVLFGELAWSGAPAAVAGINYLPAYRKSFSLLVRAYPSSYDAPFSSPVRSSSRTRDEYGLLAGCCLDWFEAAVDAYIRPQTAKRAIRGYLKASPEYEAGRWLLKPSVSLSVKTRISLRADFSAVCGPLSLTCRYEICRCNSTGQLAYLDALYSASRFSAGARITAYGIPEWESRIYVCRRDAPGNFSTKACRGRAAGLDLYFNWAKTVYLVVNPDGLGLNLCLRLH